MNTYGITKLEVFKEYQLLVPRPTTEDYRTLKQSIKEDGQQVPIVVNQVGIILDGHTRFKILQQLKMKPIYIVKEFDNIDDEKQYVVTVNLARRQLSKFSKAEIAFPFYEHENALRYKRSGANTTLANQGKPYEKAERLLNRFGKMIGVKPSTAHKMVWLIRNADEKTKDELRKDEITVTSAYYSLAKIEPKPRSEYGNTQKNKFCLNCGAPTKPIEETKCHVHNQYCCTSCQWGN